MSVALVVVMDRLISASSWIRERSEIPVRWPHLSRASVTQIQSTDQIRPTASTLRECSHVFVEIPPVHEDKPLDLVSSSRPMFSECDFEISSRTWSCWSGFFGRIAITARHKSRIPACPGSGSRPVFGGLPSRYTLVGEQLTACSSPVGRHRESGHSHASQRETPVPCVSWAASSAAPGSDAERHPAKLFLRWW